MTDPSGFPDPARLGPKRPAAPFPAGPGRPESPRAFPAAMIGLLLVLLAIAWFAQGSVGAPVPTTAPPSPAGPAPATTAPPAPATSENLGAIRGEVAGLAARVGEVRARLDALPAEAPRFDPAPLLAEIRDSRARVDELARKLAEAPPAPASAPASAPAGLDIGPLKARLDELARVPGQLADLQKRLQGLQDRVGANADEVASMKAEVEIRPAAVLFQQRKYGPALESFRTLQATHATDARVWYYSALCNGLLNGKWDGESVAWVNEGIVREQAGTPDSARIDAEFAGLIRNTGREWLDFHRKQVRP